MKLLADISKMQQCGSVVWGDSLAPRAWIAYARERGFHVLIVDGGALYYR